MTSGGQSSYSIPLWTPRGIEGIEPSLGLSYSSGGGDGLLGVGWSVGGSSQITWCQREHGRDGSVRPLQFQAWNDDPDPLCLDGQRLVQVNPTAVSHGATGAEYRTVPDTFVKVLVTAASGNTGRDPLSFEVRNKDGNILKYGTGDGSRIQAERIVKQLETGRDSTLPSYNPRRYGWLLAKVEDRSGNYMELTYEGNNGFGKKGTHVEPRVREIRYTGKNGGAAPTRTVRFLYKQRPDREMFRTAYLNGFPFERKLLLDAIEVLAPSPSTAAVVRKYVFSYDQSPMTKLPRLTRVQECDGDPKVTRTGRPVACKLPTEFGWENGSTSYSTLVTSINDAALVGHEKNWMLHTGDLDGDGRDDIVYRAGATWRFSLAKIVNGSVTYAAPTNINVSGSLTGGLDIALVDFDQDGDADILGFTTVNGTPRLTRFENSGFGQFRMLPISTEESAGRNRTRSYMLGDHNGDGKMSMGQPHSDGAWGFQDIDPKTKALSTHTMSQCWYDSVPNLDDVQAWNNYQLDVNGDGVPDILYPSNIDNGQPWRRTLDVWSDGEGYDLPETTLPATLPNDRSDANLRTRRYWFADFNGDGRKDALALVAYEFAQMRLNTGGEGLFGSARILNEVIESMPGMRNLVMGFIFEDVDDPGFRFIDYNMDGRDDILLVDNGAVRDREIWPGGTRNYMMVLTSTENGFVAQPLYDLPIGTHADAGEVFTGDLHNWNLTRTFDANGDGLTDIVNVVNGKVQVYVRQGKRPDMIISINDGMGEKTGVDYAPMIEVHEPGWCEFPRRCVNSGPWVVKTFRRDNGIGTNQNVWNYVYSGAAVDVAGGGWLGFAWRKVVGPTSDVFIEESYDNDTRQIIGGVPVYPFLGLRVYSTHGRGVEPAYGTWSEPSYEAVSSNAGRSFYVRPLETQEYLWEYRGEEAYSLRDRTTRYSYRSAEVDYGLPQSVKITDKFSNGTSHSDTTTFTYAGADRANWLIGLITREDVTSLSPDGRSVTRSQLIERSSSTGLVSAVVSEPSDTADRYLRTAYTRNARGQVTAVVQTNKAGTSRRTDIGYDEIDGAYPFTIKNNLGQTTKVYTHPALGVTRMVEEPNKAQTILQYDGFGRQRLLSLPGGGGSTTTYTRGTESGSTSRFTLQVTTSRAGGGTTKTIYNRLGQELEARVTNLDGSESYVKTRWDALGRRIGVGKPNKVGQAALAETTFTYDPLHRPLTIRRPDEGSSASGNMTERKFSYYARETTLTNEVGHVIRIIEDELGRPTQTVEVGPGGNIPTEYTYGPFGLLAKVTRKTAAGSSLVTSMEYDALGRRTKLIDPDTGTTTFAYNAFGELRSQTNAAASTSTYSYDGIGRLKTQVDKDGTTTFTFDTAVNGVGRLAEARNPTGGVVTKYAYDPLGRLAGQTWTVSGTDYVVNHTYDAVGRPHKLSYPATPDAARLVLRHEYDSDNGELVRVVHDATNVKYWEAVARNGALQLTKETFGNGAVTERGYFDKSGRASSIKTTKVDGTVTSTLQNLGYTYYPNGSVRRRVDNVLSQREGFEYDKLDRLGKWYATDSNGARLSGSWEVAWSYDDFGNLTRRKFTPGTSTGGTAQDLSFAYERLRNGGPHAVTKAPWGDFSYDKLGNQITRPGGETIAYTAFNLPKTITVGSAVTSFEYDAFGSRTVKRQSSTKSTVYIAGIFEKRTDGSAVDHVHHVVGKGKIIAQVSRPWLASTKGAEKVAYYHPDRLGTPETISDGLGKKLETLKLDPYGNKVANFNQPFLPVISRNTSGPRSSGVTRGFTEHEQDDELGLVNMRGRMYDARLGRFLSADPYVQAPLRGQSYNRFSYVFNNPLKFVDPSGYSTEYHEQPCSWHAGDKEIEGSCENTNTQAAIVELGGKIVCRQGSNRRCYIEDASAESPHVITVIDKPQDDDMCKNFASCLPEGASWDGDSGPNGDGSNDGDGASGGAAVGTSAASSGPGGQTQDASSTEKRVDTPLGQGTGYTSYAKPARQYGTEKTNAFIKKLGERWAQARPGGPRLQIGDTSLQGGGPMYPHKSHQKGVDFDVRVIRNDGVEGPSTITSDTYSRELTQELVNLIHDVGGSSVEYVFSKDQELEGVRFEANHYRHLHVRLKE